MLGMLSPAELRDLATRGEMDSVWAVTPDQYGRPVGKRFSARFFIDEALERQTELPASILFRDLAGRLVSPPSTLRIDPGATVYCRPDVTSLRRAAWMDRTAIVICDLGDSRGDTPHVFSPRAALKRQLERARSASVTPRAGYEVSFYLDDGALPASSSSLFSFPWASEAIVSRGSADHQVVRLTDRPDPVSEMQQKLRGSGVAVEHVLSAAGPGQYRIKLQPTGLLEAADRAMVLKWLVKEVAVRDSQRATFMARPSAALPTSAMEIHTSLWSSDREAALFAGKEPAERDLDLPMACRWWLGGFLRHARESTLLLAPTINSYKRIHGDKGEGAAIGWAHDHRGVGFRVSGRGADRRVTCSLAGADANPYLVGAALLASGLEGMSSRFDPAAEAGREASALRALPRLHQGIVDAADAASTSPFIRQVLGEQYVEYLAHCGRWEQAHYAATVSSWELERYRDQA